MANSRVQAMRQLARIKAASAYNEAYAAYATAHAPLADFALVEANDHAAGVAAAAKEIVYLQHGYVPCAQPGCVRLASPGYEVCQPCEASGASQVTVNGEPLTVG